MIISPFTPLHFKEANESDGLASRYLQVFAPTDQILIEVFCDENEEAPAATINQAGTEEVIGEITWQSWEMNPTKIMYFSVVKGLSPGCYKVIIAGLPSDVFRVTDEASALDKTTLIQYRFKDNKQRDDVVSVIDGMPYFFDFRVPGGFKDSGWQFGVDNEQFTTQREGVVEIFAYDFTLKTFTLGGSLGVPVWCGEMLNRLLTCSYVYFNGDRYTRNDTETPQINVLVDGLDSFVFTQVLRKAQIFDEMIEQNNQVVIRRIEDEEPSKIYRSADNVIEGENINRYID